MGEINSGSAGAGGGSSMRFWEYKDGMLAREAKGGSEEQGYRIRKWTNPQSGEAGESTEIAKVGVNGKFTDLRWHDSKFHQYLCLTLDDGEFKEVLKFKVGSRIYQPLVKMLPNMEKGKDTTIAVNEDNGIFIKQDGEQVKWYYTKDNPNGMPQPTMKKVMGKDKWDFSEPDNFLWEVADKYVGMWSEEVVAESTPNVNEAPVAESYDEDDIPF